MGKRGPKPKMLIDTTWTPELAYVIGLIATDGCLSGDGRHIDFTSADLELIKTFQHILGIHHVHIGAKIGGFNKKPCPRIQFGNKLFYEWLLHIGLTPRKSHTLQALKVPDEFFFDFLRGCFDGDGSIYAFWDKRWKSSYVFSVSFGSASIPFLHWLQSKIQTLASVNGYITPTTRCFHLRYAKGNSKVIVGKMFHHPRVPHLSRKFAKIKKILTIDTSHNAKGPGGGI